MKKMTFIAAVLFTAIRAFSQTDTSKYILFEDTSRFSTIDDIVKLPEFKNKVVYVDLWGTRCAPCIEQFKYLPELKERYKDQPVVFLYLKSPYGFDDSKEWKDMIVKYNLEGINIAMSLKFYGDNFWVKYGKEYTEERSYGIPTYLIINKKGEIVNYDAPRPGKKNELYELIDKEIKATD